MLSFQATLRRLRTLFALAALAFTWSCSGETGTDPNAPFGGDYFLKTVNSTPLPRTITLSGGTVRLNSMRLSIAQGGSYELTADYTPLTYTGPLQTEALGTWLHDATTGYVALRNPAGLTWVVGTSNGNTLTLSTTDTTLPVEVYVYQR